MKHKKMKQLTKMMLTFVLALSMILGVIPVSDMTEVYAESSGTCGDDLTWTLDDEGVLTISGTGRMTSNPWNDGYYNEDEYCQEDNPTIKSVVIEEGVESICEYAFKECINLASITIPKSLEIIREYAFCGCSSLESITIPSTVYICENAFWDCNNLTAINVSDDGADHALFSENGILYGYFSFSETSGETVTYKK
ncbi:MAG: leucine-rich repeat domain-containing protein [Lachnospiraceae bacterium]|nr:leucine-rich repeat domain-containing protein [Lachnospiraceae bacterium]